MTEKEARDRHSAVTLHIVEPYDFSLSMRSIRAFRPVSSPQEDSLRLAEKVGGIPASIEVRLSPGKTGELRAYSTPATSGGELRRMAEWVLFAELDLTPFYRLIAGQEKLSWLGKKLHGLKAVRPASLFEMAVIAITEQQISLAAAYSIRGRVIEKFGEVLDDQWIFPGAEALARASLEALRACGLSLQKAQYIHDLANEIVKGRLDLNRLKSMDDDQARETIMGWRGFGRWSADYILVRGLARPDCVPIDDLGIRSVVGEYLGKGPRASAPEATKLLEPFRPFRGLLAFYLLAEKRLNAAAAKKSSA